MKLGLPNVVDFTLSDPDIDRMALLYGIKRNESRRLENIQATAVVRKSNNYLAKQFRRLRKYASKGELEKFNWLALKLIRSWAYQVYAYNSVFPRWISVNFSTVKRHLRAIRTMSYKLSSDIHYRRVWIDKVENSKDYGRPLGVPDLEWRVYLRLITHVAEIFALGKGLYQPFQHGGVSGKGVLTALEKMVEYAGKYKYIYEYDLKGYFDHIRKDCLTWIFRGTFLEGLFSKLLDSKPHAYVLPPKEHDKAVKVIQEMYEEADDSYAQEEDEYVRNLTKEILRMDPAGAEQYYHDMMMRPANTAPDLPMEEIIKLMNFLDGAPIETPVPDPKDLITNLERDYAEFMETGRPVDRDPREAFNFFIVKDDSDNEEVRAKGRDDWKDLNLEERGIPQGTTMGPFLAGLIAGIALKNASWKDRHVMYMDDGIVFGNEPMDLADEINAWMEPIGVEVNPKKCRLHDQNSLMTKGLKFLGTRLFKPIGNEKLSFSMKDVSLLKKSLVRRYTTVINYVDGVMTKDNIYMESDTRKGIKKVFATPSLSTMASMVMALHDMGVISPSKKKLLMYLLQSDKRLGKLLGGGALHLAIKWGFFGSIVSNAYNPAVTPEDMKRLIAEGIKKAEKCVVSNRYSLGSALKTQSQFIYLNTEGEYEKAFPDLYNYNTLGVLSLLEMGPKATCRRAPSEVQLTSNHSEMEYVYFLPESLNYDIISSNPDKVVYYEDEPMVIVSHESYLKLYCNLGSINN